MASRRCSWIWRARAAPLRSNAIIRSGASRLQSAGMSPVNQMVQCAASEVDLQGGPPGDEDRVMGIGLVLALTAALAYGASDFLGGTGSRRHSSWAVVLVGQLCGAALMVACGLLAPADPRTADFAWALLAGLGSA